MKAQKALKFFRWIPAILFMGVIFWFSSIPSESMLHFDLWDTLLKKTGHFIGYACLALCYWYALGETAKSKPWLVLFLTVIYALTDEWHQSFVPGRGPSFLDVGIDAIGAATGLSALMIRIKKN